MSTSAKRILIVEDDEDISSALARGMRRAGYVPMVAFDAAEAERILAEGCDLAIVDAMLGEDRGEDIIRKLRAEGHEIPIIMLSALSSVEDRMRGLEVGADDYVAKPYEMGDLIARVQVQEGRRAATTREGFRVDADRREVTGGGRSVTLTQRELDLLQYMLDRRDTVLSRGEIFDALWLNEGGSSENVVDVYIGYLRRKLTPTETFGVEIRTVRGRGFVLSKPGGGKA
ncbi:MAG: response regulator transcription factor [Pseudomonadota bacterium]